MKFYKIIFSSYSSISRTASNVWMITKKILNCLDRNVQLLNIKVLNALMIFWKKFLKTSTILKKTLENYNRVIWTRPISWSSNLSSSNKKKCVFNKTQSWSTIESQISRAKLVTNEEYFFKTLILSVKKYLDVSNYFK